MLASIALRLFVYARIPAIYDVIPRGPQYSQGTLSVLASQIIKSVSEVVEDKMIGAQLNSLGKQLYSSGTQSMSYDDDGWCGTPYPHHFPHIVLDPEPHPWFENVAAVSVERGNSYYGGILNIVAQSISDQRVASELNQISNKLMGQTSGLAATGAR